VFRAEEFMLVAFRVFLLAPLVLLADPVVSRQLLKTGTTWNGAPIKYSAFPSPEVQAVVVEIAPGASTVWHRHPVNNFAYILEGTLRLELDDRTSRVFQAGDAFAEVVETLHMGTNIGSGPLKILVFYSGQAGMPITVAESTEGTAAK
jgi:quercetin dioxygenase-like cupin family protein